MVGKRFGDRCSELLHQIFDEGPRQSRLFEDFGPCPRTDVNRLDDKHSAMEATGDQFAQHCGEINLPLPGSNQHIGDFSVTILSKSKILDADSDADQTVHVTRIVDRVQGALRIVEDVARVIPKAEIRMSHEIDALATCLTGRVQATMGLHRDRQIALRSVVAAGANRPVVGLKQFWLTDSTHEQ